MADIADTERTYSKSCQRVFEKYGYPRHPVYPLQLQAQHSQPNSTATSSLLSASASSVMSSSPANNTVPSTSGNTVSAASMAEFISSTEAPGAKRASECAVRAFGGFAEAHSKIAEVYADRCCPTADVVQRRVEACKKELMEKQQNCQKKLDAAKSSLIKLLNKLSKIKRELRERRNSVLVMNSNASGIESSNASGNIQSSVPTVDTDSSMRKGADSQNKNNINASSNTSQNSTAGTTSGTSVGVLQSLESIGTVLGLETQTERTVRLENRIINLEEEEEACIDSLQAMVASIISIHSSVKFDMTNAYEVAKHAYSNALYNINNVFKQLYLSHMDNINKCRQSLDDIRTYLSEMDVHSDMNHFIKCICNLAEHPNNEEKSLAQDLPPEIIFQPNKSELIEKEKKSDKFYNTMLMSSSSNNVKATVSVANIPPAMTTATVINESNNKMNNNNNVTVENNNSLTSLGTETSNNKLISDTNTTKNFNDNSLPIMQTQIINNNISDPNTSSKDTDSGCKEGLSSRRLSFNDLMNEDLDNSNIRALSPTSTLSSGQCNIGLIGKMNGRKDTPQEDPSSSISLKSGTSTKVQDMADDESNIVSKDVDTSSLGVKAAIVSPKHGVNISTIPYSVNPVIPSPLSHTSVASTRAMKDNLLMMKPVVINNTVLNKPTSSNHPSSSVVVTSTSYPQEERTVQIQLQHQVEGISHEPAKRKIKYTPPRTNNNKHRNMYKNVPLSSTTNKAPSEEKSTTVKGTKDNGVKQSMTPLHSNQNKMMSNNVQLNSREGAEDSDESSHSEQESNIDSDEVESQSEELQKECTERDMKNSIEEDRDRGEDSNSDEDEEEETYSTEDTSMQEIQDSQDKVTTIATSSVGNKNDSNSTDVVHNDINWERNRKEIVRKHPIKITASKDFDIDDELSDDTDAHLDGTENSDDVNRDDPTAIMDDTGLVIKSTKAHQKHMLPVHVYKSHIESNMIPIVRSSSKGSLSPLGISQRKYMDNNDNNNNDIIDSRIVDGDRLRSYSTPAVLNTIKVGGYSGSRYEKTDQPILAQAPSEESVLVSDSNIPSTVAPEILEEVTVGESRRTSPTPVSQSTPSSPPLTSITATSAMTSAFTTSFESLDFAQPLLAAAASVGINLSWPSAQNTVQMTAPAASGLALSGATTSVTNGSSNANYNPNAYTTIATTSTTTASNNNNSSISSSVKSEMNQSSFIETPFAQELARFNLSSTEKVLHFFSCALYPKRGMLTHGRYVQYFSPRIFLLCVLFLSFLLIILMELSYS